MNVRKLKRKCAVKGCRNKDTYAVSKIREYGDTVIICPECLQAALKTIKELKYENNSETVQPKPADKPLFYSHLVNAVTKENEKESGNPNPKFVCSKCGRECASQIGLASHEKACKG